MCVGGEGGGIFRGGLDNDQTTQRAHLVSAPYTCKGRKMPDRHLECMTQTGRQSFYGQHSGSGQSLGSERAFQGIERAPEGRGRVIESPKQLQPLSGGISYLSGHHIITSGAPFCFTRWSEPKKPPNSSNITTFSFLE